jgi:uncharacterized protein (TIGR03437 family)
LPQLTELLVYDNSNEATASTIPPPTVLGGWCVTFDDIAVPLLISSSGQIQAQVPDTLPAGTHVVEVRTQRCNREWPILAQCEFCLLR